MRKCPHCAEEIQNEAIKCKHCAGVAVSAEWRGRCERYAALKPDERKLEWEALPEDERETLRAALSALELDKPRPATLPVPAAAPKKRSSPLAVGCLIVVAVVAILFGISLFRTGSPSGLARDDLAGQKALDYLPAAVEELQWVEFSRNNAYIAFDPIPDDLGMIIGGAALRASKASNFGFHVWALDAKRAARGSRPGDVGILCEATARYGKVQDNDCR